MPSLNVLLSLFACLLQHLSTADVKDLINLSSLSTPTKRRARYHINPPQLDQLYSVDSRWWWGMWRFPVVLFCHTMRDVAGQMWSSPESSFRCCVLVPPHKLLLISWACFLDLFVCLFVLCFHASTSCFFWTVLQSIPFLWKLNLRDSLKIIIQIRSNVYFLQ